MQLQHRLGRSSSTTLALLILAGCGGGSSPSFNEGSLQARKLSEQSSALASSNGLSVNGVSVNGVSVNGVSVNGVSVNGVSVNGVSVNGISPTGSSAPSASSADNGLASAGLTQAALSRPAFAAWFVADESLGAMVMSYMARCALASTASLSFTSPASGVRYTWSGNFALTPLWTSGLPINTVEQQLITACLLAHANKYGVHVHIAVEGETAWYVKIPIAANELSTYPVREAAFFGNGFTGEGFFACVDHTPWSPLVSSPRACALDQGSGPSADCPPINVVGLCSQLCTADLTGTYYTTCSYGGRIYKPLVTRLEPASIYTCGDGVCEFTESCGPNSTSAASCESDCGACASGF